MSFLSLLSFAISFCSVERSIEVSKIMDKNTVVAAVGPLLGYRTRTGKGYNNMCSNSSTSGLHLSKDYNHNGRAVQKAREIRSPYFACYYFSPLLRMG